MPLQTAKRSPKSAWENPITRRSGLLLLAVATLGTRTMCLAEPTGKTFENPIIPGYYPDPSICRVGDDYYTVHSTFEYFPGVPVFHSKDLVHWRQIGHVLTRKSQLNLDRMRSSGGIFAPTIRYHNGTFYMVTTSVGGGGNFYVTATNAAGPWSEPVRLDRDGIDPSLLFDDDGKVYYTRQVGGERGYSGQQILNLQTGKLEGDLKELWRGTGGVWPEGPHLYKIKGKYYLMISEGGTSYDHMLTVARSDSPWGPFEANPNNPILTHRNRPDHAFQALGHGDLVETPEGWWVVFLGFRPQGGRLHHLGRETFLAPVTWNSDGWPVVNEGRPIESVMPSPKSKPHPWPADPARVEFNKPRLGLEWVYVRNPVETNYSLAERSGFLRLKGSAVTLKDVDAQTLVGRRQTDLSCRAATLLSFEPKSENEEAGLVLRGNDRNHLQLGITLKGGKRQVFLRKVLHEKSVEPVQYADSGEGPVELIVTAKPLEYAFFFKPPRGVEKPLGTATTRELSTEVMSAQQNVGLNFTGVVIGLYATGNGQANSVPADFDWFEYEPVNK